MARTEMGRRLSLQQGVIAAVGLVLGQDEAELEDGIKPPEADNGDAEKGKRPNECSLETAVQVTCTCFWHNTVIIRKSGFIRIPVDYKEAGICGVIAI